MKEKKKYIIVKVIVLLVMAGSVIFISESTINAATVKITNTLFYDGECAFIEEGFNYRIKGIKADRIRYISSNKKIVKVSKRGKIYAKKQGKATIKIKYKKKNKKKKVKVKVTVTPEIYNKAKSIKLYDYELSGYMNNLKSGKQIYALGVGDERQLYDHIKYNWENNEEPYYKTVFKSKNEKVVKVNKYTGVITGVAPGKTKVYVYTCDGSHKKAFMDIEVSNFVRADESNVKAVSEKTVFNYREEPVKATIKNNSGETITYLRSMYDLKDVYKNVDGVWEYVATPYIQQACSRVPDYIYVINPGNTFEGEYSGILSWYSSYRFAKSWNTIEIPEPKDIEGNYKIIWKFKTGTKIIKVPFYFTLK
ncbi:MAG: Ig-like domain-containing protein [Eubacterium sp.]